MPMHTIIWCPWSRATQFVPLHAPRGALCCDVARPWVLADFSFRSQRDGPRTRRGEPKTTHDSQRLRALSVANHQGIKVQSAAFSAVSCVCGARRGGCGPVDDQRAPTEISVTSTPVTMRTGRY